MGDLAERIKASLSNRYGDPWYPELTMDLAAIAWDALQRDIGLTPDNYGTERVLSHNLSAPRKVIASLSTSSLADTATIWIEALTQKWILHYRRKDVNFHSRAEILNTSILACAKDALAIINEIPSLTETVSALVRSLHLIKPQYVEYDISFSEPHVPLSIFVSVPERRTTNDALRVAEAIVHEAMHLQLSLIENVSCLVNSTNPGYFSPWRKEYRRAGGILHGLYVFYVIHSFLGRFACIGACPKNWLRHIGQRQREIRTQLNEVRAFQDCSDLTATGSLLVQGCFKYLDMSSSTTYR